MDIINKYLSLSQFQDYVNEFDFGKKKPTKLVIHHTWRPTKDSWAGERSIFGFKKYYEKKKWAVGPHMFIAEEGIWLFTPMNRDGIHASSLNKGSIGIEIVGDYDLQQWSGQTKTNALGAIKILMDQLSLTPSNIFFHRDVSSKSCPGWAITKEWLFYELEDFNLNSSLSEAIRNTTAPIPVDYYSSLDMVLIQVPDWAKEAVDFIAVKNKLFKIRCAEDVRDAVKMYRFYKLIK